MPITLYRFQTQNLSFAECWYQTRSPAVLLLWVAKILRQPLPNQALIPRVVDIASHQVSPEQVAPEIHQALAKYLQAFAELGFCEPEWSRIVTPDEKIEVHVATSIAPSGTAVARVFHSFNRVLAKPIIKTRFAITSRLSDGTFLVASGSRPQFHQPPLTRTIRKIGANPARLWDLHQTELARLNSTNPPLHMGSLAEAHAMEDAYEDIVWEDRIQHGIFAPLTAAEQAAEEANNETRVRLAAEAGPDYAPVLMEIDRLERAKSSRKTTFWLLIVSLAAFAAARQSGSNWAYLVSIVPILFVHETGHWIAMRAFGYRNLKMLFIPFFGAAVIGRHYNVAGWKKAIVSLAGPAPSIVVASSLFVASLAGLSIPAPLQEALYIAVVLNAYNMLPIVPLDGGWFLNAVLFCRHPLLETGFKVAAVLALVGLSLGSSPGIFLYLAAITALSVPATWRRGKIARQLRSQGLATQSDDGRTVPTPTAIAIIESVRNASRVRQTPAGVAQESLDIFERLNAVPPNIPATFGLLATYCGIFLVALIGYVGFGARHFAPSSNSPGAARPALRYRPGEDARWNRTTAPIPWTNRYDIIGNFPQPSQAADAFSRLTNQPYSSVTRFGQSVFVTLERKDSNQADQVAATANVPLSGWSEIDGGNRMMQGLVITGTAAKPAIAEKIEEDFDEYAEIKNRLPPSFTPAPPWAIPASATAEQIAADRRARHTWKLINEVDARVAQDPSLQQLTQGIAGAIKSKNSDKVHEIRQAMESQRRILTIKGIEDLLARNDETLDDTLLKASLASAQNPKEIAKSPAAKDISAASDPFAALLASKVLMIDTHGAATDGEPLPSSFGSAAAAGTKLKLNITTENAAAGLPIVAHWLTQLGCTDLRYRVIPVAVASENENDENLE